MTDQAQAAESVIDEIYQRAERESFPEYKALYYEVAELIRERLITPRESNESDDRN